MRILVQTDIRSQNGNPTCLRSNQQHPTTMHADIAQVYTFIYNNIFTFGITERYICYVLKHTRLGNVENIIFEVFERAGVSFSLVERVRDAMMIYLQFK